MSVTTYLDCSKKVYPDLCRPIITNLLKGDIYFCVLLRPYSKYCPPVYEFSKCLHLWSVSSISIIYTGTVESGVVILFTTPHKVIAFLLLSQNSTYTVASNLILYSWYHSKKTRRLSNFSMKKYTTMCQEFWTCFKGRTERQVRCHYFFR